MSIASLGFPLYRISSDRHRAEVRRAVNDEFLSLVAGRYEQYLSQGGYWMFGLGGDDYVCMGGWV